MSLNQKKKNNNKELISERSQSNKLVQQNDVVSNNDLIKVNQNNNQLNDEELQKSKNNSNSSSFNIDALELEQLMGDYKERGKDYKDLKYFEKKPVSQLISELKSDPDNGITSIEDREKVFGSNIVYIEPVKPFCYFIWEALDDLMVRILIVAAIVSIVLGCTISEDKSKDWIDGLSIIVAVLVVVLVGSITNYNKELKFHELNEVQAEGTTYKIIRNGKPEEHISDDLLVGDIIMINYGEIMAADILLIEGNGIRMDESALTGESDAMKKEKYERCSELLKKELLKNEEKKVPSPLILSGTNCVEGSGKGMVIAVGEHSQKGIIRRTVDNAQENSKTPLEEKLERIAELIGYFGLGAGVVTLIALAIRFGISFKKESDEYNKSSKTESIMSGILFNLPYKNTEENFINHTDNELSDPKLSIAQKILDIIILCISIIVVAIPEGLPLAVTLSLAFSIKKMMDYNNLVRKMHACETMGGANFICTDKTGTLTKNEMSVFQVLTGKSRDELKQNIEVEDVGKLEKKK